MRRESFTSRHRRQLARTVSALEQLEPRNSVADIANPLRSAFQAISSAGLASLLHPFALLDPPRARTIDTQSRRSAKPANGSIALSSGVIPLSMTGARPALQP
jgi:hypothetical protein